MADQVWDNRRLAIERDKHAVGREPPVGDWLKLQWAGAAKRGRSLPEAAVEEEEGKDEAECLDRRKRRKHRGAQECSDKKQMAARATVSTPVGLR